MFSREVDRSKPRSYGCRLRYLRVDVPIVRSSDYALCKSRTERLVDLLTKVGAEKYLSGPSARGYLETWRFREAGIGLE